MTLLKGKGGAGKSNRWMGFGRRVAEGTPPHLVHRPVSLTRVHGTGTHLAGEQHVPVQVHQYLEPATSQALY